MIDLDAIEARAAAATGERAEAIALAERVLDRPYADPDDDLAVLARQFNRALEQVRSLSARVAEATGLLRAYQILQGGTDADELDVAVAAFLRGGEDGK